MKAIYWIKAKCRSRLLAAGAVGIAIGCLFHHQFKFALVIGNSMLPTLKPGDLLVVNRQAYRKASPCRGDLVLGKYGKDWVVKRIVGLPGEEVEVKDGTLFINDLPKPENHPSEPGPLSVRKGRLLAGDFATLGDNRSIPSILAVHPIFSRDEILGKVVFVQTILPTWARFRLCGDQQREPLAYDTVSGR